MPASTDMTWEQWQRLPERERAKLRDLSDLNPQLAGLEGWRVAVRDTPGYESLNGYARADGTRSFIVGRSTGWKPIHLEVANRASTGGFPATHEYAEVRRLERVR